MAATILNGSALAATLRADIAARAAHLPRPPGLAVVLVGQDPASTVYVRNKDRAAREAGLHARTLKLPADTTQATLLDTVATLNADPAIDGILVQMPLPPHLDAAAIILAIDPEKDVDGFHPLNVGRLAAGEAKLVACTPRGVMKLLAHAGAPIAGARAIVLGRSGIVGRPVASLLLAADATVTIAHSKTRDLAGECRRADIVIAAVGRPELVRAGWIKPGATVIDVGINRTEEGKLLGDVAFAECAEVAGAITPVPGGVGPMTIACLLENTLMAAVRK